jgi:trans-aconitate methyltransferase
MIDRLHVMNIKYLLIKHIKPKFFYPFKIKPNPGFILDIGVANNSYQEFKNIYPNSVYHGIDYVESDVKFQKDDKFILENLESSDALKDLSPIYDMIVVNHVLEHLNNGKEIFSRLCELLAPGGVLYAEFPSIRTAHKKKTSTSYHFHDDITHKSFYLIEELANLAIYSGCNVISCGAISTRMKNFFSPIRALISIFKGEPYGPYLLHRQKKIDHIFVERSAF